MESIILVAGSTLGAFTALVMSKVSKSNTKPFINDQSIHHIDLHRRVVTEAMNRVYDYERQEKITGIEREKLITKYKQELNTLDNRTNTTTLHDLSELNAFKDRLVAVVDQRMAQINSKLDDITSKMTNNTNTAHNKPITRTERKEEKHNTPKPVEFDEIVESADSESDTSLDNLREQIMQTLSSLEQAEVE
ncbi:MAG: hypothetical protein EX285_00375 [Thaumarchaeota archaeon]|nr:hypothetical protein [Nitrososphaerota archaeon]